MIVDTPGLALGGPIFVGRDAELALAREAIERACSGDGALVMLSGEPGIGKTRLASEIAAIAASRDSKVVWGRCWEAGGAPAYWPWVQALRALGGADDPFAVDEEAYGSDAKQIRFRQFERALRFLKAAAQESALAIVLDDLHAADVPSLLLLQFIARDLRGSRLLLVGTHRQAEARSNPEIGGLLAKIAREGRALTLGRLGHGDVLQWLKHASPNADAVTAKRIHGVTEGNPLFVSELLRVRGAIAPSNLPDGLRTVIDEHVARVSPKARDLLSIASVLGRDIAQASLVALSGFSEDEVARLLLEALEAGLLASPAGGERLAFFHVLLRERLYAALAPSERAALHWRAGEWLGRTKGDLATAAYHLLEGAAHGSVARALDVARRAASQAISRLAFEEAADICTHALALLTGSAVRDADSQACELELLLGEARIRAGQSEPGKAACLRAAEYAKKTGSADQLARSALGYAAEILTAARDPVMTSLLEAARAALGDREDALVARVLARLAASLGPPRGEVESARTVELSKQARALARKLGDPETLLFVLHATAVALGYRANSDERFEVVSEIVELARRLHRPIVLLNVYGMCVAHLLERGALAEADAALDEYAAIVRDFPQPHYRWRLPMLRSMRALLSADFDSAERLAAEAYAIAGSADVPSFAFHWALHLVCVPHVRGEPSSIAKDSGTAFEAFAPVYGGQALATWVHAALGHGTEATRGLAELVVAGPESFPGTLIGGEVARLIGDRDAGAKFYAELCAAKSTKPIFWGPHGTIVLGPTVRVAADLAAMLGRIDEARALYEEAIAFAERMRAPALIALARRGLDALPKAPSPSAPTSRSLPLPLSARGVELVREGDVWRIRRGDDSVVLKDAKGLQYLERLVKNEGREIHVMELADMTESADLGPALDAKAKAAYRKRLEELRDQAEEASRFGDELRLAKANAEIEALAHELKTALGLGGRDRQLGSHVERARINVQRRLRDVVKRISEQNPDLARYVEAALKTGTFCSFVPV